MIVAAVIGMLLVVVAFALFIPLNRATGNLYNFFQDSCQDRNSRFNKVFIGVSELSTTNAAHQYDTSNDVFGGAGKSVTASGNNCQRPAFSLAELGLEATAPATTVTGTGTETYRSFSVYNEFSETVGNIVITVTGNSSSGSPDTVNPAGGDAANLGDGYKWYKPSEILGDFIGICRTLISLSPVIVVAGFLTLAGTGLVRYGMGVGSGGIAGAISAGVIALVINIAVMYLAPIGINSVVKAGQYTQTGALAVNQEFGDVQRLLFAVIPLIMIAVIIGSNALAGGLQFGMGSRFRRSAGGMMGV